MSFLIDLALAHQKVEGYFAPGQNPNFPEGTLSWRNHNPGNLRLEPYHVTLYGASPGLGGFACFPTYQMGLQALMDDLRAKITGHSSHIDYAKNPTFLNYVQVYAPSDDGNDPNGYCQKLIRLLPQYHLTPSTPLVQLAALLNNSGEIPVVSQPQDHQHQLQIAQEAIGRVTGPRLNMLLRLIGRLKKLLGQ